MERYSFRVNKECTEKKEFGALIPLSTCDQEFFNLIFISGTPDNSLSPLYFLFLIYIPHFIYEKKYAHLLLLFITSHHIFKRHHENNQFSHLEYHFILFLKGYVLQLRVKN